MANGNPTLTNVVFTHDAQGNVVTKEVVAPVAQTNQMLTPVVYSHDAQGNVVTKQVGQIQESRILTPVTFSHDAEGNVVTKGVNTAAEAANTITLPAPFISNTAEIAKTGQVSPGVVEIGKGMYGNLSTLKLASSGNGGIPITPGSVKVTEEVTKQSEPSVLNFASNVAANLYNEVAGVIPFVNIPRANATAGFEEKTSTLSYEQKVPAPFISQNLTGYKGNDIVLTTKQSDVTTEKSLYSDVGSKIGSSLLKPLSIEDSQYSTSSEAKALSVIGGAPAVYANVKSAYLGAYDVIRDNPLDIAKYAAEGVLLSGAFEGAGVGVNAITKGTKLEPVVSTLATYKIPELAIGATVGYGVVKEVTSDFTDYSTTAAYKAGQISVPLASMGVGAGIYSMKPLSSEDIIKPTTKSSEIIKPATGEFGSIRQSGDLTTEQFNKLTPYEKEMYNLYGTTTPMSDLIAKQAFERRTESAIRSQSNAGGDILTRAYESSRKEPAVAPWEREINTFDLKTLNIGKPLEIKTSGVGDIQQPVSAPLTTARNLISNIPEPSTAIREPALQSWERTEILKRLYPEEYSTKPSFGEYSIEPRTIFKSTTSNARPTTTGIENLQRLQKEVVSSKQSLPYKEPIDTSKLNKLLSSRGELNILTESEVKQPSIENIVTKGYDWNVARKMGTVGESTSPTPKVLLQLQSRVSPASTARAYAEVSPYTSVPSELELSAMKERLQKTSGDFVADTSKYNETIGLTDTKSIIETGISTSPATKTDVKTLQELKTQPDMQFDILPYPKTDTIPVPGTRTTTITDILTRVETAPSPKPRETTTYGGGGGGTGGGGTGIRFPPLGGNYSGSGGSPFDKKKRYYRFINTFRVGIGIDNSPIPNIRFGESNIRSGARTPSFRTTPTARLQSRIIQSRTPRRIKF